MKRERILPKVNVPSIPSASAGSAAAAASTGPVFVNGGGKPLSGMQFIVIGRTSKKKSDVGKAVTELGGKLVTAVDDKVAACISTKGEITFLYSTSNAVVVSGKQLTIA